MKKLTTRICFGFILVLLGLTFAQLLFPFAPQSVRQAKAKLVVAHVEIKEIAILLKRQAVQSGELTNIDNNFILDGISGTNGITVPRTDDRGELVDPWQTPYQIKILERTNFVVISAGPNKKFGDVDDIIFNSASNSFVKP